MKQNSNVKIKALNRSLIDNCKTDHRLVLHMLHQSIKAKDIELIMWSMYILTKFIEEQFPEVYKYKEDIER